MTEESIRHRDSISPPGIRRLTRRPGSRPRYRLPFSGIESVTGDRQSRLEPVQGLRSLGVLPTAQQRFGWEQWPEHVLIVFRKVSCLVSRAAAGVQYRFPASSSYNRSCAGHSINLPHRHRSRRRGGMSNPFPRLFRSTGYFIHPIRPSYAGKRDRPTGNYRRLMMIASYASRHAWLELLLPGPAPWLLLSLVPSFARCRCLYGRHPCR
jgi:hypothetical protein